MNTSEIRSVFPCKKVSTDLCAEGEREGGEEGEGGEEEEEEE